MKTVTGLSLFALLLTQSISANPLDHKRLESVDLVRIAKDEGTDAYKNLEVYLSRAITIKYQQKTMDKVESGKGIEHKTAEDIKKTVITESTKLRIQSTDNTSFAYVKFDSSCESTTCSLYFAANKKGDFELSSVPEKIGYKPSFNVALLPIVGQPKVDEKTLGVLGNVFLKVSKKDIHTVTRQKDKAKGF